ncbi:hypothetical protein TEA_005827 [Camellia sinensis var. sinensis]|uniref:Uncharacterized protein n=1 Tax=Camellia sinensis var. sinensis TaxID=542762 RepID=A0A4S4EUU2_CAMSN|nr:hypothetical protein TEA_005827 [Camellia sinensis var. sinensis]
MCKKLGTFGTWLSLFKSVVSSSLCISSSYKHDPEVSEDTEKNFAELLSEELKLRETEALESQQRADMALLEAKKITSQYQKEADKCNSGMETCKEAREKAEAVLLAQKRLTAMWESRAHCAKHDPEVSEDTEKNFAELLSEELKLRETEALESQQRADMALLEAKKITSQYQKEADKCNSGMETCKEAREKAEAVLLAQKRLTAMWESRAR